MKKRISDKVRKEEADNLRNLIPEDATQSAFAKQIGAPVGKSVLSQILSLTRPISLDQAIAIVTKRKVPMRQLSPRFADQMEAALKQSELDPAALKVARDWMELEGEVKASIARQIEGEANIARNARAQKSKAA